MTTSNNTMIFFICLMLPFLFKIVEKYIGMFMALSKNQENEAEEPSVTPDVFGLSDLSSTDVFSIDDLEKELEYIKKELKQVSKKLNTPCSVVDKTDKNMIKEAASALHKLGVKKSEANAIVKDLCKKKTYTTAESLTEDAVMCI